MSVKQENCPFCGATGDFLLPNGPRRARYIRCELCHMRGPTDVTTAMAWNKFFERFQVPYAPARIEPDENATHEN